jgi:hypothetical protein
MSEGDDPILEAVSALRGAGTAVEPSGDELDCWLIGDMTFSDADLWRLAVSRGLVEAGEPRQLALAPKTPSLRGARPRRDIRPRVLAALTPEPSTAARIAERAGLPGRERAIHATRALLRLEADGLAVSQSRRSWTRWRSATAPPASARSEPDPAR